MSRLRARWILDGLGNAREHHAFSFEEGILRDLSVEAAEGQTDLGDALITPGFVNPHVHLDLSFCPQKKADSFAGWVRQVIRHRMNQAPEVTLEAIRSGVNESLAAGVTMVGDISSGGMSWEILEEVGLRGTVYYECLGLSPCRSESALEQWEDWRLQHPPSHRSLGEGLQPGISPHAPYSTGSRLFALAGKCGLPVATHLAETGEEMEFLQRGTGPLRDLLWELGIDPALVDLHHPSEVWNRVQPARHLALVHGNYWQAPPTSQEPSHLSGSPGLKSPSQGWVHCPRTHAFFEHPVHPFEQSPFDPAQWSLGTDGRSSNPDLNLLEEARMIHHKFPRLEPSRILRMITSQPAHLLGWGHRAGSLEAGKWADFLVWRSKGPSLSCEEPHQSLLEGGWKLEQVWIAGERKQ